MSSDEKDSNSTQADALSVDGDQRPSRLSFFLTLISNLLFLIASILYLYLAILGLWYEEQVKDYPDGVLEADDDASWVYWGFEDDYVLKTPITKTWITRYQVIYFFAALGFVISGLVDLYHWRSVYALIMIFAGGFGVASAVYVEEDEDLSNKLNMVSVHLWLLEAFTIYYSRDFFGGLKTLLRIGDCFFIVGTLMDVVLSWFYHTRRGSVSISIAEITAACCWMIPALIYLYATIVIQRTRGDETLPMVQQQPVKKEKTVDLSQSPPASELEDDNKSYEL